MAGFKKLFKLEKKPIRGLLWLEWVVMAYTVLTSVYIAFTYNRLHDAAGMLWGRGQAVIMMLALWGVYRLLPCRMTLFFRVAGQLLMLSWWYPDTFEMNRILPNLDHIFAQAEQALFGLQPALVFSQQFTSPVLSELLTLGYVSYFPMIAAVTLFYFLFRYEEFLRASFTIIASFFLFYVIFIAVPAAGPQFYYPAVGLDQIAAGVFPSVGDHFDRIVFSMYDPDIMMPSPGWKDGLFYHLLVETHNAGERPTAAFPSSHMGITTVVMWLAYKGRSRSLFFTLLPLAVLMFFATFYIYAHYAIDAIAGVLAGTAMFFAFFRCYKGE